LASNIRHGVSSLTQPLILAPSRDYFSHNEQLHQQVMKANERADQATQIAAQANQKCTMLEDKIKFMEQKFRFTLTMLGTLMINPCLEFIIW